jgi:molybdate transport system substrate-binding protein
MQHRIVKPSSVAVRALVAVAALLWASAAWSAEVKVMISGGLTAAYNQLVPQFEHATGNKVVTASGPSMGTTVNAIPVRLARGEPADVLIMVGYALGDLIKQGKVEASSRVDIARSPIGMVVRAGAPKPDISTVEAFKRTLLAATSVAYSDSASGVYVGTEMFEKLGILDQMKPKSRMIPADPVGSVVARGDAELGFQQISELIPVPGVDLVGPLPPEVQKITIFSAGIVTGAKEPEAGRALIRFLASVETAPVIRKTGLDPMAAVRDWQKALAFHIARFTQYPREAHDSGQHGRVRVAFTIDRDGWVRESHILESSGSPELDGASLAMLIRAQPMPKPPVEAQTDELSIVLPLMYVDPRTLEQKLNMNVPNPR